MWIQFHIYIWISYIYIYIYFLYVIRNQIRFFYYLLSQDANNHFSPYFQQCFQFPIASIPYGGKVIPMWKPLGYSYLTVYLQQELLCSLFRDRGFQNSSVPGTSQNSAVTISYSHDSKDCFMLLIMAFISPACHSPHMCKTSFIEYLTAIFFSTVLWELILDGPRLMNSHSPVTLFVPLWVPQFL